ncbi:MAG: 5-formyltetrahydrofolate cyclo-ligase [Chromatiales bacterium]|jgi:5-formyltetrahydrofolate cyclo-ligase
MTDLRALRGELRSCRRGITEPDQRRHGKQLGRRLEALWQFRRSRRIAFYLAEDGEIDLTPAMQRARRSGKEIYLPVLRARPSRALWFCEYRQGDRLLLNRFGIAEPDMRARRPVPPWALDLVLLPLVGFDECGNRLGMGGGFYDRTLAFRRHRMRWCKPRLIGVAHECQKVARIPHRPWDIQIDGVTTEARTYLFGTAGSRQMHGRRC